MSFRNLCWTLVIGSWAPLLAHAGVADEVRDQCGSCHALTQPDYSATGRSERLQRKAPPLYFAGNKFRREWLESWLQKPERIRPAGVFPPDHVRSTPEGDVIDDASLKGHMALPADKAASTAEYLMQLRPFDDRIGAQSYQPGKIALRMGQMNFGKFKGCDACHRDAPDFGGLSGPELHSAWKRLQPQFISAFIADPTAWDPNTLMPRADLNEGEVHKLADYLKALEEEQQ